VKKILLIFGIVTTKNRLQVVRKQKNKNPLKEMVSIFANMSFITFGYIADPLKVVGMTKKRYINRLNKSLTII
jgi:hypothetical protein